MTVTVPADGPAVMRPAAVRQSLRAPHFPARLRRRRLNSHRDVSRAHPGGTPGGRRPAPRRAVECRMDIVLGRIPGADGRRVPGRMPGEGHSRATDALPPRPHQTDRSSAEGGSRLPTTGVLSGGRGPPRPASPTTPHPALRPSTRPGRGPYAAGGAASHPRKAGQS